MTDNEPQLVSLSQDQLKVLIEAAAERGARKALHEVGLGDDYAAQNIQTLRSVAKTIEIFQSEFWKSLAKNAGRFIAILFMLGAVYILSQFKHVDLPDIPNLK